MLLLSPMLLQLTMMMTWTMMIIEIGVGGVCDLLHIIK